MARGRAGHHPDMGLFTYLVLLLLSGLVVGALARLALPGRDPMSIPMTIGIGLAGSFVAGLVYRLVTDGQAQGGGLLLSVLAATGLVYLVRRSRGGDLTRPGGRRPLHH